MPHAPSLPSFAATFKDLPPPMSNPQPLQSSPNHHQLSTARKRPYDAVDSRHNSDQEGQGTGDSDQSDEEEVVVKEEPQDDEHERHSPPKPVPTVAARPSIALPPINTRSGAHPTPSQSSPSPLRQPPHQGHASFAPPPPPYSAATSNTTMARKKRRVTVSSTFHQHNPSVHQTTASTYVPPSSGNNSATTPGGSSVPISPVVIGFNVPPEGVDQLKSALSLKYQQKALIEQRRSGGVASQNPSASTNAGTKTNNPSAPFVPSEGGIPPPTPPASGDKPDHHFSALPLPPAHGPTTRTSRSATVTHGSSVGYHGHSSQHHLRNITTQPPAQLEQAQPTPNSSAPTPSSNPSTSSPRVPGPSVAPSPLKAVNSLTQPTNHLAPPSSASSTPYKSQAASWQTEPDSTGSSSSMTLLARRRGMNSALPSVGEYTDSTEAASGGRPESAKRVPTPLTVKTTLNPMPTVVQHGTEGQPSRAEPPATQGSTSTRDGGAENRHPVEGNANRGPVLPPRNPLMMLDPVIRSAPIGGRLIHSHGERNGEIPGITHDRAWPLGENPTTTGPSIALSNTARKGAAGGPRSSPQNGLQHAAASNQQGTSPRLSGFHHAASPSYSDSLRPTGTLPTQLTVTVPQTTSGSTRSIQAPGTALAGAASTTLTLSNPVQHHLNQPQVPISATLRTPRATQFPSSVLSIGSATDPSKQAFMSTFSEFYDALQGAQSLKVWLEAQAAKSDQLTSALKRSQAEIDKQREDLDRTRKEFHEKRDIEILELRARIADLEQRLSKTERVNRANEETMAGHAMDSPSPRIITTPSSRSRASGEGQPTHHDVIMADASPSLPQRHHFDKLSSHSLAPPPFRQQSLGRRPRSSTTAGTMTSSYSLNSNTAREHVGSIAGSENRGRERAGSITYPKIPNAPSAEGPGGLFLVTATSLPEIRGGGDSAHPRAQLPGIASISSSGGRHWPDERIHAEPYSTSGSASNGTRSRRGSNAVLPGPPPTHNSNASGRRERRESFSNQAPPGVKSSLPRNSTLTPPERALVKLPPLTNGHDLNNNGQHFSHPGSPQPPDRMQPPPSPQMCSLSGLSRPSPRFGSPVLPRASSKEAGLVRSSSKEGLFQSSSTGNRNHLHRASSRSSLSRPSSPAPRRDSPLPQGIPPSKGNHPSIHRLHAGSSATAPSSPTHRLMDVAS